MTSPWRASELRIASPLGLELRRLFLPAPVIAQGSNSGSATSPTSATSRVGALSELWISDESDLCDIEFLHRADHLEDPPILYLAIPLDEGGLHILVLDVLGVDREEVLHRLDLQVADIEGALAGDGHDHTLLRGDRLGCGLRQLDLDTTLQDRCSDDEDDE